MVLGQTLDMRRQVSSHRHIAQLVTRQRHILGRTLLKLAPLADAVIHDAVIQVPAAAAVAQCSLIRSVLTDTVSAH